MDQLDEVHSRLAIQELSGRYMRGLDRLDKDLLGSVFHPDASTDYGFFLKAPRASSLTMPTEPSRTTPQTIT